jgi:hypothetical protein
MASPRLDPLAQGEWRKQLLELPVEIPADLS